MSIKTFAAATALIALAQPALALEKITFQMSWKAQAEHGGYYQAIAKGFYTACGLEVVIRQGGPGVDPAQLLAGGAIDATIVSQNDAVLHLNEAGFPGRAVMAAFQRTPQILMTHAGNGIEKLEDMKGKGIMISASARSTYWPFFRTKYGWTDAQIRSYSAQLAPWFSDKMAIQQGLVTNEPYLVKRETGEAPTVFLLADYGYQSYGSVTTISQALIDKKPDVARCLVQASVKGWDDFLKDPKPAFALIQKDDPANTDDLMAATFATLKSANIVESDDTRKSGFGVITEARWKEHFDMLVANGLAKADLDWKSTLALQFLPAKTN